MGLNRVGGKFFTRVNIFEALPEFHQQSSSGFMVIVPAREAFFNHPHKFDVTPHRRFIKIGIGPPDGFQEPVLTISGGHVPC